MIYEWWSDKDMSDTEGEHGEMKLGDGRWGSGGSAYWSGIVF
jgi:hypothetical protein